MLFKISYSGQGRVKVARGPWHIFNAGPIVVSGNPCNYYKLILGLADGRTSWTGCYAHDLMYKVIICYTVKVNNLNLKSHLKVRLK